MNFTTWQIDRLRRGLNAYRAMKGGGSSPLPWKTVLDHILRSDTTKHDVPMDGSEEGPFKQEALRRFAKGLEVLQPEKLADVRSFLIHKCILQPDELESIIDFKEALTLFRVLGSWSHTGHLIMQNLLTRYSVVNVGSYDEEHIELHFTSGPTNDLVAVEERVRHVRTYLGPTKRDGFKEGTTVRRGYAFTSSPRGTLHIFLRGSDPDDHSHYVNVPDPLGDTRSSLNLVRSGAPARVTRATAQESPQTLRRAGLSEYLPQDISDEHIERVRNSFNILLLRPMGDAYSLTPSAVSAALAPATEANAEGTPVSAKTEADWAAQHANWETRRKGTELLKSVQQMAVERVEVLLAEGADVNVTDRHGMTALHHAAAKGARPCIRLLVASGKCDYLILDDQGRYAFELAIEWARDFAVARLLMKKQMQQAHERGVPAYVPRR